MLTGVVDVGSNGRTTGGRVPGGRLGMAAKASELTWVSAPLGSTPLLEEIADDAGADDRSRFLPRRAVGLAGPAFHPVGDVVLDAVGRHPAIERQHLHGGAFEDRQDVDRNRARCSSTQHDIVSDMTVTA